MPKRNMSAAQLKNLELGRALKGVGGAPKKADKLVKVTELSLLDSEIALFEEIRKKTAPEQSKASFVRTIVRESLKTRSKK